MVCCIEASWKSFLETERGRNFQKDPMQQIGWTVCLSLSIPGYIQPTKPKTSFPTGKTLNFFALLSAASAPTSSAVAIVIFRLTVGSLAGRHT